MSVQTAYFTIREKDNEECPNVGTIGIEYWDKSEHNPITLYNKIREALLTHFDVTDDCLTIFNGIEFHLIFNAYPMDFTVEVDGNVYKCSIEQTFLY